MNNKIVGSAFRRHDLLGDAYDCVRVVSAQRSELGLELTIMPVNFGDAVAVDAKKFANAYTRAGVKQEQQQQPSIQDPDPASLADYSLLETEPEAN